MTPRWTINVYANGIKIGEIYHDENRASRAAPCSRRGSLGHGQ